MTLPSSSTALHAGDPRTHNHGIISVGGGRSPFAFAWANRAGGAVITGSVSVVARSRPSPRIVAVLSNPERVRHNFDVTVTKIDEQVPTGLTADPLFSHQHKLMDGFIAIRCESVTGATQADLEDA